MSDKCSSGSCSTGSCSSDQPTCSSQDRLPPGILAQYDLNKPTADGTLVWIETATNGSMKNSSAVLLAKAKELNAGRVFAIVFGDAERKSIYSEAFSLGTDTIYHIRSKELNEFHPEAYADAIRDVSERVGPAVILIAATPKGKEIAPRVAASLSTGIASNCIEIQMKMTGLTAIRKNGNVTETITFRSFPNVVTLLPQDKKIPKKEEGRKGTAINRPFTGKLKTIVSKMTK